MPLPGGPKGPCHPVVNRLQVNDKNLLFNLPCISVSFKRKCLFSCLNLSYRDTFLSPLKM